MEIKFKKDFVERYSNLTNFKEFKEISLKPLARTIRVNTLKSNVKELKERLNDWDLKPIKFYDKAFEIEHKKKERRDVGNLKEHFLGHFYLQESASLLPPLILNPKKNEIVLDVAASPGSKTTQMAAMMENTGIIVANDVKPVRLKPLSINLQRCGVVNTVMTLQYGQRMRGKFEKILLDAPCSGTGAIRKSIKTLQIYNKGMIKKLSYTQRDLLFNSFKILEKNGEMVYSTCSLEPEENEGVVNSLLEKNENAKLEKINVKGLKTSDVVLDFEGKSYNDEIKKCLRIWPQDNDTEGFFVAKIKKV
ncbi:MAG: tRNA methyltransferase [Nanoarchaeota archaeon]|nr:tRNA methyltransferase [Nanoarchaeota archaeon]